MDAISIMSRLIASLLLMSLMPWGLAQQTEPVFAPKAVQVAPQIYAVIGPLGQRSQANAGLNANYGFVLTDQGVILVDSGASAHSAALLEGAVKAVTDKPIRWVLNTGSQDHRWLGNDYFARKGASIHALASTVQTQRQQAEQQISGLERFVGDQIKGTKPRHADVMYGLPENALTLDGVQIEWIETSAHFPGDAMIYLPQASVVFTGDLVYVDRMLSVLPLSNLRKANQAFERLRALAPKHVVPGHGRVTDMVQAQKETGDYYQFLITNVGSAARNMDPMTETLDKFSAAPAFKHLHNFDDLHRANMNRVFVDFESNP